MSIKFLTFGNVVRTAMMPVFGAIGVIFGGYAGEVIDFALHPEVVNKWIPRACSLCACVCTALIGAVLRLRWEQHEHEKKHNDALHLVD